MKRAALIVAVAVSACGPDGSMDPSGGISGESPCTQGDAQRCCAPDRMVCTGDPDRGVVCTCPELWRCPDPRKCNQPAVKPEGDGWHCTWVDGRYACERLGDASNAPAGGGEWRCRFREDVTRWHCERRTAPTPSNSPEGASRWRCTVDDASNQLRCVRRDLLPAPSPGSDAGPAGGGDTSSSPPPPPPLPTPPPPKKGAECVPGQKKWCDGTLYCGWGQVECMPDGRWKRDPPTGALDCRERADGRRPNTKCGCYHFFWEPSCCERPDCILPAGTQGRICGKSAGKLCDYCNPTKPECREPGGSCVMTSDEENFCTRGCSASNPCPTGYACRRVKRSFQCLPKGGSCYQ